MAIPGAMHPDPVRGSHSARATAWSTLDGVPPVLPAGASRQPPLAWHGNGGRRTRRKGAVAQGEGRSGEPTSSASRRPVCGRTRVWQQYQFERKPCALAAPPATPQGTAPLYAADEVREVFSLPVDHVPKPPVRLDDREGSIALASGARAAAANQEYLAVPKLPQASRSLSRHQAIPNAATAEIPTSTCPIAYPRAGLYQATTISRTARQLATTSRISGNRLIGHTLPRGPEPSTVIRRVEGPAGALAHNCELVD
jgi:hypothetical protein